MARSDYTAPTFIDVAQAQWGSPPAGAVALDAAHINAMANAIGNSARQYPGSLNVKDFGAKGDGATDDSSAFAAAATAAKAALRTMPFALQGDKVGGVVIDVPPGDYVITTAGAMLGNEGMTEKGSGLVFRGSGKTVSNIVFKPATAGALITDDYWLGLQFRDLGFVAATAGCTFLRAWTTHSAQRHQFISCRFERWKYGIDVQGSDNNSEMTFLNVDTNLIETGGAFFYIGATNTTDQFLNYWFYGCTHWSTSAPFIDAASGGGFHIFGLDCSDFGGALSAPGKLFYLRGTTHAFSVCQFEASGVRSEFMSANAGLIYSEWNQGNVVFRNVDITSQAGVYTYGDTVSVYYNNNNGPMYRFTDCYLAGGVRVKFDGNDYTALHSITFDGCQWLQRQSPSDVVSYDTSSANGTGTYPPVDFANCVGPSQNVTSASSPATTWDARIGFRGQALQALRQRTLSVRGPYGTPLDADTLNLKLPVGALITAFEVMAPAGAFGQSTGATFTLATKDTTPVTVATVTVSGALSAGFDVTTSLASPFDCTTTAKATLTIKTTGATSSTDRGVLLVKGYW